MQSSNLALLAALCAIGNLLLPVQSYVRHRRAKARANWLVLDGSNIMHWKDNTDEFFSLRAVTNHLSHLGYIPAIVFDANVGHKISNSFLNDRALAKLLHMPVQQLTVVSKGTPADPTILIAARNFGARVVSDDRFRDYAQTYPDINEPGFLIRGGHQSGEHRLDLPPALQRIA
jgi:hypothetical protein